MSCSSNSNIITACSSSDHQKIRRSNNTGGEWSELPQELLHKIIQDHISKDPSHEVLKIRSVCKSWRASIPNPNYFHKQPFIPITFPFSKDPNCTLKHGVNDVAALEILVVALRPLTGTTSHGGGILKLKRKRSGKWRVMSPFWHQKCVSSKVKTISEVVNLLDYQVDVLYRSHLVEDRHSRDERIVKAVVIGNMLCALIERDESLALCKFGDRRWTKLEGHFHEVKVYKDKLYGVDQFGHLFMIDPLSLKLSQIARAPVPNDDSDKYLVESLGDLFLVDLVCQSFYSFISVYKLDQVEGQWVRVWDLGDRVFFTCDPECSFSVSLSDFPNGVCKIRNCVYFTDDHRFRHFKPKNKVQRGLSTKFVYLYSFEDGSIVPAAACPGAMDIFWNLKRRKRSEN